MRTPEDPKAFLQAAHNWARNNFKEALPDYSIGNVYQHEPCSDGTILFHTRFDLKGKKKQPRWFHWNDGKFRSGYQHLKVIKEAGGKYPPFTGLSLRNPNPKRIKEGDTVFIVEGHKLVVFLLSLGLLALTSGSSSTYNSIDLSGLPPNLDIRVWPDNDDVGIIYAIKMAEIVRAFKQPCKFIDPKTLGLDEHGDVVDWCALNPKATKEDILAFPLLDIIESPEPPDPETEWKMPLPPGDLYGDDLSPDFLPGPIRNMVNALAAATLTPKGASIEMGLAVFSTALQRKFIVRRDQSHHEALSFWTLVTLESGTKKTRIITTLIQPLVDYELEYGEAMRPEIARTDTKRDLNKKLIAKLLDKAADPQITPENLKELEDRINDLKVKVPEELFPPQLHTSDATPEGLAHLMCEQLGAMAILSAEGGIFQIMGGMYSKSGAAILDIFLKGHTGETHRITRRGTEKKRDDVNIPRPALAIGLLIQPHILQDIGQGKHKKFKDIGLMGRFSYFIPKNPVGERDLSTAVPIPHEVEVEYNAFISKLLRLLAPLDSDGKPVPIEISMSAEAHKIYNEYAQEMEYSQAETGRNRGIMSWASKAAGNSMRIAAFLCVGDSVLADDSQDTIITGDQMTRAVGFCKESEPHTHIAFKTAGMTQLTEDTMMLYNWIVRNDELVFTVRDIKKAYDYRFREDWTRYDAAMGALVKRYIIRPATKRQTGGRPSPDHEVNPAIFKPDPGK